MDLLTQLQTERYRACLTTTLDPVALAEIGRVMVHYGLLVDRVREFVSYVASLSRRLPPSIGSKESIKLLPAVMAMVKPAFTCDDYQKLQQAIERVTIAREAVDRIHYSSWGVSPGDGKIIRTEYRPYKRGGCWLDKSIYTTKDLNELAMEISLAINYLGKAQGILRRKVAEESNDLRRKFDRKLSPLVLNRDYRQN